MASDCAQGISIPICLLVRVHTLYFRVLLLMLCCHSSYLKAIRMVSSDLHTCITGNKHVIACQNSAGETEDTISLMLFFFLIIFRVGIISQTLYHLTYPTSTQCTYCTGSDLLNVEFSISSPLFWCSLNNAYNLPFAVSCYTVLLKKVQGLS